MLANVALWGLYSVMARVVTRRRSTVSATAFATWAALPLLLPLALIESGQKPPELSPNLLLAVLYIGIFAAFVAFLAWNEGIRRVGPTRAMAFYNMLPVYGALLGALIPERGAGHGTGRGRRAGDRRRIDRDMVMEIRIESLIEGARRADGTVVVIDVFRAFTTAAVAFARGVDKIILTAEPEEALALRERGLGDLCMGEGRWDPGARLRLRQLPVRAEPGRCPREDVDPVDARRHGGRVRGAQPADALCGILRRRRRHGQDDPARRPAAGHARGNGRESVAAQR